MIQKNPKWSKRIQKNPKYSEIVKKELLWAAVDKKANGHSNLLLPLLLLLKNQRIRGAPAELAGVPKNTFLFHLGTKRLD